MGVCRTLFDQLDTDGSGGIDGDELAAGLAAQGYQVRVDPMPCIHCAASKRPCPWPHP